MKIITTSLIVILLLLNLSCSTTSLKTIYPTLNDGKYDSEFPYRSSSEQLKKISETIQRVNCVAYYTSYVFDSTQAIEKSQLTEKMLDSKKVSKFFFNRTGAGSSTIIYNENGRVALLTDAHVISFPDTIFSYIADRQGNKTVFLQGISLKTGEHIYISGFPGGSEVKVIAIDKKSDLAIVGNKFSQSFTNTLKVFDYPNGYAKELEWGSFVYIFGYPLNDKMISKAIVSSPNYDDRGSFLIDAVVNRGFSGGVVLAIRDGVPHFELVGIVQWMPQETNYFLAPQKSDNEYSPFVAYKGDEYVEKQTNFIYGITKVIPIERIDSFVEDNRQILIDDGYHMEQFFGERNSKD